MGIHLLHPLALLLGLLVPLALLWPRPIGDRTQGLLRAAALLLLVVGLARPFRFHAAAPPHHVVVLDTTASVGAEEADRLRQLAAALPDAVEEDAWTTLVLVGETPAVEGYDRVIAPAGAGTSPLAEALEAAVAAVPVGVPAALTVLGDGAASTPAWGRATAALTARAIPVHVVRATPARGGVAVTRVVALDVPRVGHTCRLLVEVVGRAASATVRVAGDGIEAAVTEPLAVAGAALVPLEVEPSVAGFVTLVATVSAPDDAHEEDDRLATTLAVQDPLRVLHLGGRVRGGAPALAALVGRGFAIEEAARAGDLGRHDLVVLDDRPAEDLPRDLQERLVEAVRDGGVGLLAAGGRAAFGPGGWHDEPIAEILPVEALQREEKRDPSTTLVVIIDTSGSMGGNRVQLAKEVARLAMRRLLPHDKVGIVEFYGAKRWAAPIQPASNAIELQRALNRLQAGGGTVILPAIEEAFYALQNVQTRTKHVLVLTDGGVERGAFEPLIRKMAEEGITVSTVLVGPQTHSAFLVDIANWGRGRFYSVPNRFNLPQVLLKEPASARLPAWRPGRFAVDAPGAHGWWGEVDVEEAPPLAGYVETRARPGAEVPIAVAATGHPVLASWRWGLGRVTAFTTEPVGDGTGPWADWPGYGRLLARALTRTARRDDTASAWWAVRRGPDVIVGFRRRGAGGVAPRARVVAPPEHAGLELDFRERAPGHFEARLGTSDARALRIEGWTEGEAGAPWRLVVDPATLPAREHQVPPDARLDLAALAAATGGTLRDAARAEGLVPDVGGAEAPVSLQDLTPLALLLALLAWLGELAWRRRPGAATGPSEAA